MTNADESILPTETFRDYKNIKNNNRFIVKGVLGKGELSALISDQQMDLFLKISA